MKLVQVRIRTCTSQTAVGTGDRSPTKTAYRGGPRYARSCTGMMVTLYHRSRQGFQPHHDEPAEEIRVFYLRTPPGSFDFYLCSRSSPVSFDLYRNGRPHPYRLHQLDTRSNYTRRTRAPGPAKSLPFLGALAGRSPLSLRIARSRSGTSRPATGEWHQLETSASACSAQGCPE